MYSFWIRNRFIMDSQCVHTGIIHGFTYDGFPRHSNNFVMYTVLHNRFTKQPCIYIYIMDILRKHVEAPYRNNDNSKGIGAGSYVDIYLYLRIYVR